MSRHLVVVSLLGLAAVVSGCTGPVGPVGGVGDTGPAGPAASLPEAGIVQGLVIQHDFADDASSKNGVVHVRAKAIQLGGSLASIDEDADLSRTGIGGLDQGTPATTDTWYAVMVVSSGGSEAHAILTTTPATVVIPAGYVSKRVGWARWLFGGSPKFLSFRQVGHEVSFLPDASAPARTILSGRDNSSAELADAQKSTGAGTEKDIAQLAPPDVYQVRIRTSVISAAGGNTAEIFWGHTGNEEPLASCSNSATVGSEAHCSAEAWITLRSTDRRFFYGMATTGSGAVTFTMIEAGYLDESI